MANATLKIERERALRHFEVTMALMSLAALTVALVVHHQFGALGLAEEARGAITLGLLLLAAIDAIVMVVWERLMGCVGGWR